MYILGTFLTCLVITNCDPILKVETSTARNVLSNKLQLERSTQPKNVSSVRQTRRVLRGREVGETRPYMVYLRAADEDNVNRLGFSWLCGGVIIHEQYILTSAACIEDASQFYVVSGTHKWVTPNETNNECINKGATRAVWKCVPKDYYFDGADFDNIRWMVGDIAVVKVEESFNFQRRVRGCDFIPNKIAFNNISLDFEKAGTSGTTVGWGSTDGFNEDDAESPNNSENLLEAEAIIISKKSCKKYWESRYHSIIDDSMICTKDLASTDLMSPACADEVDCKEMVLAHDGDDDEIDYTLRRAKTEMKNEAIDVHTASHVDTRRAKQKIASGGFCENDHGGPLIVGHGKVSTVVGVITACHVNDVTRKCYGPFLYTSVYKYRNLIMCAIDKEITETCRRLLRTSAPVVTHYDWSRHSALRTIDTLPKVQDKPTAVRMTEAPAKGEESE